MRRFLLLISLALAAGTLGGQPSLKFLKKSVDLGPADPKGAPVAESVAFVNAGDEPLVVLKVAKSCECVQAKFSKRPVMPGDTAVLTVTFNPLGQQSGDYLRALKVYANTPEKMHILTVQGSVGTK